MMHELCDCKGKKFQCSNESSSKDDEIGLIHWVELCVFGFAEISHLLLVESGNLIKMIFELVQTCLSQGWKDVEASGS